jgi:hypothetical protein
MLSNSKGSEDCGFDRLCGPELVSGLGQYVQRGPGPTGVRSLVRSYIYSDQFLSA